MDQASVEFKIEVKGIKEVIKQNKYIEETFVKGFTGIKNRNIVNKMRQRLQIMFPGAKITAYTEGQDIKLKMENVSNINRVNSDVVQMQITQYMEMLQMLELGKAKGQRV